MPLNFWHSFVLIWKPSMNESSHFIRVWAYVEEHLTELELADFTLNFGSDQNSEISGNILNFFNRCTLRPPTSDLRQGTIGTVWDSLRSYCFTRRSKLSNPTLTLTLILILTLTPLLIRPNVSLNLPRFSSVDQTGLQVVDNDSCIADPKLTRGSCAHSMICKSWIWLDCRPSWS